MKSVKVALEKYFSDNWTETPIRFQGDKLKPDTRFIEINFIPIDRTIYSTGNGRGRKRDLIQFKISCFDSSSTLVFGLEDKVREFLECYEESDTDYNFYVGEGVPSGRGATALDNGVFVSISLYEVRNYN